MTARAPAPRPLDGAPEAPDNGAWAIVTVAARAAAAICARGAYQAALLDGYEAWSGSTLRGRAKTYGSRYARSRDALDTRLREAGLMTAVATTRPSGKKIYLVWSPGEARPLPQVAP